MNKKNFSISFGEIIELLLEDDSPFPLQYLYAFSDISPEDLDQVKKIWPRIEVKKKLNLLLDLEQLTEEDTLVACDDLGKFALDDDDPQVRGQAIRLLAECDDPKLAVKFSFMLENDPSEFGKESAARALGKFIYLGELDEIPPSIVKPVMTLLLKVVRSESRESIRLGALESLAYSGDKEVRQLIEESYHSDKRSWRKSALLAMGRSADERWEKYVLESLADPNMEIQQEAIQASGELELSHTKPILIDLVNQKDDPDIFLQAIWALSKIGGADVRELINDLIEKSENDDETDMLELALDNMDILDGHGFLPID